LRWVPVDIPTVADYLPDVIAGAAPGARRTYAIYWTYILTAFGDRRLDQVTLTDIEALMRHHIAIRRVRANDRGGHSTAEHLLAAIRTIYVHAVNDELLPSHHNPAARVANPDAALHRRGTEALGGNTMPKKRMPTAERQRDSRPMAAQQLL